MPCPECTLEPGVNLTLPEYEQFWSTSPGLDFARSRNAQVNCNTCGRLLTFQVEGAGGFHFKPDGTVAKPAPSFEGPYPGDPAKVA